MSRKGTKQKLMAMALSAILFAGVMPVSASAQTLDEWKKPDIVLDSGTGPIDNMGQNSDESSIGKEDQEIGGKIIMAFTELEESVAQQSAALGTPLSELYLPDTLLATVDDETIAVPVTWACEPEYKGEAGEYVFTAVIVEGYTLAEGVKAPNISAVLQEPAPPPSARMELMGVEASGTVVISQEQVVSDIASAIQTALSIADNATVIVTGSKTDVGSMLSFNIPEGKTVVWKAVFKGSTSDYLIRLTGKGAFEVAEGGEIDASAGVAIAGGWDYINYDIPSITVSGGTINAEAGCAIYINGGRTANATVTVSGGMVSNAGTDSKHAIHIIGPLRDAAEVNVTIKDSGTVETTGTNGYAICTPGSVLVQDSAKISATGNAIFAEGNVLVRGTTVSAPGNAIFARGNVLVQGSTVSTTGNAHSYAICGGGSITVEDSAVEASGTESTAIFSEGNLRVSSSTVKARRMAISSLGSVLIQGTAEVSANGENSCIAIYGNSITVEGGTVEASGTGGVAIYSHVSVLVQDTAEVSAIGANGFAIIGETITVKSGGSISATGDNGTAISGRSITVEDGATVSATGTAIFSSHNVSIIGGLVNSNGSGIVSQGNVSISGGTIRATGSAIFSQGNVSVIGGLVNSNDSGISSRGNVSISGGTISANSTAISGGSVTVEGGTISATDTAISSLDSVLVNNTAKVTATGASGIAIYGRSITVKGGTVEAIGSNGNAISAQDSVLVIGGTISATGTAISGDSVTVEEGKVEATGDNGKAISGKSTITIKGGTVSANGNNGTVIYVGNYMGSTITISGGVVSSKGTAIYSSNRKGTSAITVEGGLVFGRGSKIANNNIRDYNVAIYMTSGTPAVNSPGTVIAWNKTACNKLYGLNADTDLTSLPESTAKWSRADDKSGISYGTDGFLEIDGISVAEITASATGLDELKVGKDVDAAITYTLTGGSYASGLNVPDFVPEGRPDWLKIKITDTVIESTTVRVSLSGTPTGSSEPLTLTLPTEISATNLTDGSAGISIPVSGAVTIGAVVKGDGASVADLTTAEITATYVMLEPITGLLNGQRVEYAISATDSLPPTAAWQESARFSGLFPNTEYYVFARSKENENYAAGNPSSGIRFKTAKAQLCGTVSIDGTPAYGATMTAVIGGLYSTNPGVSPNQLGALSYQWWRRNPDSMVTSMIPSATDSSYTLTEADIGKIIRVEVMAANCEGTVSGSINKPTDKAMPIGTPIYTQITHANQTLADAELKGNFLNPHNNISVPGVLIWKDMPETPVQRGKAYSWIFMPAEEANYNTAHGSIILWPAVTGGGGSGSYMPPATNETIPGKAPNQPITAVAFVTATVKTDGTVKAEISWDVITGAIAKAQEEAKKQEKTANGISVDLNVNMPEGTSSLSLTLSQNTLQSLVNVGVTRLTINGRIASLGLDLEALKEIQRQSTGSVTITIKPMENLSTAAKKLIGTRPVYDVTVSYIKDGKTVNITSLGKGGVTLSFPYTPSRNEAVGYLFGVYVNSKGNATRVPGSAYDANSGGIILGSNHFSVYGVGYQSPSKKYTDIFTHWARESIDYVVGRGLFSGTTDTKFSPNTAMDRGMLVTVLGRLAGADVSTYKTSSFTDVAAGKYYLPYVEWAYKKGIVSGIGNGKFAPDRAVTREEIAVIFTNYARATGYKLPITREAIAFADASSIGSIYQTTVTAMQQAGVMMGGSGNKFNPKAGATRAEVAAMFHRYIKLTIDPGTAQGWSLNDAGQYLYYKDGKALTGKQTIDGVKYFFNTDGTLKTGWVKDGDNWRFYSGNRALVGWGDIGNGDTKKTYYFTKDGLMVSGKWLQLDGKWYYFNADGSLARNTAIDGHEVDENGVRNSK